MDALLSALEKINESFGGLDKVAEQTALATKEVGKAAESAGKAAEKGSKGVHIFGASLLRIVKYRILRSVIRSITSAFQEGLQNAYHFSQTIDGNLAKALDTLSTKSLTMKNQLGAAFGSLITTLEPVIQKIIEFATRAAEAITRLFAILGGQGGYKKAVDASKQWAENTKAGAGSAKEMRRQLMGFDVINRLDAPSGGGGSGGGKVGTDYTKMFEWVDLTDVAIDPIAIASNIVDKVRDALNKASDWISEYDWNGLGGRVYDTLKRIFTEIDWGGLAGAISRFLGNTLGAAVSSLMGFAASLYRDVKDYFKQKTEEMGGNVILGFLKGILDAVIGIGTWIYDHVIKPFVTGFLEGLGIEDASSVTMEEIGTAIVKGLQDGIEESWEQLKRVVSDLFDIVKDIWDGLVESFFSPISNWLDKIFAPRSASFKVDTWTNQWINPMGIPGFTFASGGFPEDGFFFANHNEMVGQFSNGKTAVANNDEIVEGIKRGVLEAMTAALSGNSGTQNVNVYLDGKQITNAVTRNQRQMSRATGVAYG